jgi:cytochrome P450
VNTKGLNRSAVVNEALRIHPSTGTILERLVPSGGIELHGIHIPEDTVIGVNAWVMNRNKEIYGEETDCFRPERWIDIPSEKEQSMRRNMLTLREDQFISYLRGNDQVSAQDKSQNC